MKLPQHYELALTRALSAQVPIKTDSYTPIPHSDFLITMKQQIINNGYNIATRRLYTNVRGTKLVGFYDIDHPEGLHGETGIRMSLGFQNSYDKSMRAAIAVGGSVIICSNGMIAGDLLAFTRKHTGTANDEISEKIQEAIESMNTSYTKLISDADIMKQYNLTRQQKAQILGIMYFEHELVTAHQIAEIKKEYKSSETFKGDSVWDLYNNVTQSLKTSHPIRYIADHIRIHDFMLNVAGVQHFISPEDVEIIEESKVSIDIDEQVH